ncbi:hypothetical protein Micbo1qcDRAFT_209831 [Microdochium bolleyi]|uniref:BZIP domain-containing protein n=1 Tax=Microdochium bolleyi TaxID=196109 RepID=A0A136IKV2_9PEZI|nr:hypothetical protein Micbo1qcDRAFT_209831 [Microdochium bolleyi]
MDFSQQYFDNSQPSHFTPTAELLFGGLTNFETPQTFPQNFQQFAQFRHQNRPPQIYQQQLHFPSHIDIAAGPPTPPSYSNQSQANNSPFITRESNDPGDIISATKSGPEARRAISNSVEDMTLAQSRRKAQNRAAQRASRQRKEDYVKTMKAKLATLEAALDATTQENERLKRELQRVSIENEVLQTITHAQAR